MRVLLDNDVVLDYILQRSPFFTEADQIFAANANGDFESYVSGITPVNVFYIARKTYGIDKTRDLVEDLLLVVKICQIDNNTLNAAFSSAIKDFEDAVQHTCAVENSLDTIVTRNIADYKNAAIPVLSPTDFLKQLKNP